MSKTVQIGSKSQFDSLLQSSKIVVTDCKQASLPSLNLLLEGAYLQAGLCKKDTLIRSYKVYADWCGPCKQIAPIYEQLSVQLSRPNKITFAKVNTDQQLEVAQQYGVTAWATDNPNYVQGHLTNYKSPRLPTFIIFKNTEIVESIKGADPQKLQAVVKKLSAEADSDGANGFGETSSGGSASWTAASLPKGYSDVTDQVDVRGLDLLNSASEYGTARTLFDNSKPSSLDSGKGKGKGKRPSNEEEDKMDWVESDTDEQLMLYVPFMSTLKVHTIHITSLLAKDDDEPPMRPKTIQIYSNRAHVLGFDEAEDLQATQTITLNSRDWDEKTGTAKIELRFVKFQHVTSLVVFIVDGDGDGEKVRIDRIRIVGESGEKRDPGKLEKVGEHD